MTLLRGPWSLLLFAIPGLLLAAQSDTVNERIPVRKAELEAHWQIDCAASWSELRSAVGAGEECMLSADLHRQLKLCAYIYQAPGAPPAQNCPDYRGAINRLEPTEQGAPCPELATFLRKQNDCTSASPDS